jgi:hypothetical protein
VCQKHQRNSNGGEAREAETLSRLHIFLTSKFAPLSTGQCEAQLWVFTGPSGRLYKKRRPGGAPGRRRITGGGSAIHAADIRRLHYRGRPVSGYDSRALGLTARLIAMPDTRAPRLRGFSAHKSDGCPTATPKRVRLRLNQYSSYWKSEAGEIEPSANWGSWLTNRASVRILFAEPDNCHFEILFALSVDEEARLAGENGRYSPEATHSED